MPRPFSLLRVRETLAALNMERDMPAKSPAKKPKSLYVDGYLVPVKKSKLAAYKAMAKFASKIWREYGAIAYHECVADDVPMGKWTSFPRAVKLKDDEVVIFSWIAYASRKDRDRVNKAVMQDKRLAKWGEAAGEMFDGKRIIFGGFKEFVGG